MSAPDQGFTNNESVSVYRFGVFQVNRRTSELFRQGVRVKVQDQPMHVLLMLLENPGEIVTREDIRLRLWPADTFVEFDHSVNTAIKKLRQALGDDADNPRFVETLPRKGYRFIAPVTTDATEATPSAAAPTQPAGPQPEHPAPISSSLRVNVRNVVLLATAIVAVTAVALLLGFRHDQPEPLGAHVVLPLTTYAGFEDQPSLSPDGQKVAFTWAQGTMPQAPPHIFIKQVGTEQILQITKGNDLEFSPSWSPDGNSIAFLRCPPAVTENIQCAIYVTSTIGGVERLLKPIGAIDVVGPENSGPLLNWSPDGKTIAYSDRGSAGTSSIMLLDVNTLQSHELTTPKPPLVGDTSPSYSPDGKLIAFARNGKEVADVWVVNANGGTPRQVSNLGQMFTPGMAWTSDGSAILFGGFGLFRVPLRGGKAEPLMNGSIIVGPSIRGGRLVFSQYNWTKSFWSVALDESGNTVGKPARILASTRDQEGPKYSPDGKRLVFGSLRSGYYEIWRSDIDGSNLLKLTNFQGPLCGTPSFSPDGRSIIFDSRVNGKAHIFTIGADGGPMRQLTDGEADQIMPSYSRDGRTIYFPNDKGGTWNVWKIPAEGGTPVQVTKEGGFNGAESPDGKFYYYSKSPKTHGLWRIPLAGGKEEQVSEKPITGLNGYWSIRGDKVYFGDGTVDLYNQFMTIRVLDLSTGRTRELLKADYPPAFGTPGLTISPDGRNLLYVVQENSSADLQLIENFH